MGDGRSIEDKLKELLFSQRLGVLATQRGEGPYTSLVAFACSEDLRHIAFATPRTTRKFANILSNSRVSFFVDNRSNEASDFREAIGVTASGSVREIRKNRNYGLLKLYLGKHPQLESFLYSRTCGFLCIDVESFYFVERFQNVTEIHVD